ncbi:hypothetical protein TRICI_005255 [Trichomonascus ciferrii]|uniref:Actin binding protein n=1 Tax=Trichomonascus ciferrii TaxID=44093 RepID=A0A642UUE6_9ASCO|nr:hypothetical protein TRICI_005255 [Trichomonascus ciferrii]
MSYTIDLASHGKELKQAYDAVISSDPSVNWAVFNYDAGQSSALKLATQGGGPLSDFVEEFDDGKVQYGFAKVDYNNIPKYVLVGWVGEGVPERTKGYFNAHYATVAKYFRGYHVQITARSSDDLSESIILQKVHDASGSKYSSPAGSGTVPLRPKTKPAFAASSSIPDDEWGDGGASIQTDFQKVPSSYKPTKVEVGASKAGTRPEPVKSSHEPVGKVDIAALRASGKDSKFADSRPAPVQSSYQPVGKVDIAAIRAQAKANPNYKSTFESQPIKSAEPSPVPAPVPAAAPAPTPSSNDDDDDDDEGPKLSVKDRMKAFGGAAPSANYYSPPPPSSENKDEDDTPKSFAERKNAFANNAAASQPTATATVSLDSGRLTSLPKPKVANTVSGRYGAAAAGRGTAPALPSDPLTSGTKAAAGFKDFASEGGKTPAQLWAEKHGKAAPAPSAVPEPVNRQPSPEPVNREPSPEPEIEKPDMSSLRDKFSHASVEDSTPHAPPAPPAREESASSSFSDITSRFAQQNSTPPPLPSANRPVPPAPEPEPEQQPVPEPETHFEIANPVPRQSEPEPAPAPAAEPVPEPEPVPQVQPQAEEEPPVAGEGSSATALYDYEKDEDNEIQLVEGELVTEIDFVDTEWWAGKNQKGEYGLFPAAYVELKGDNAPVTAAADQAPPSPEPQQAAAPVPAPTASGPSAVAEYDYEAAEEGELTFPEGAIITDIDFVDENWWSGVYNGERNLFPANYVTLQN